MTAQEIRNAAPMVVVMFAPLQSTKPSQVSAQQSISTMLVFARVSAVQIVIVRETRSAVVMAVVASVVLQYNKPAPVVLHS